MKTTFVVISVSDRVDSLNTLLGLISADRRWDAFDINIMFQDPDNVAGKILHRDRITNLFVEPEKLGCHGARVLLLNRIRYDGYVNMDDDIEPGPHTNYIPALEKAAERDAGFVITRWARTPELLAKKVPTLSHSFSKQIMVYNGGGMAYTDKIAELMRALPPLKTAFDCAWPITAYVNGYTNYYYHGSLAVHRVRSTGGMKDFKMHLAKHVMGEEWLRFRPSSRKTGTCRDVCIPLDNDVLPVAKARHKERRLARFGY